MESLKNKKALVTGGSRGLGKAIALALASEGVHVVVTGRDEVKLSETVKEIEKTGVKASYAIFDVSNEEKVKESITKVIKDVGAVDILINNAGIGEFGGFLELSTERFEKIIQTNLFGPYYIMKNILPAMVEQKSGDVVNVASTAGLKGGPMTSAYTASKAGLIGLSESVMYEMRKHNIRVCTLTPSTIATDMSKDLNLTDGNPEKVLQPEDFAELVIAQLKLNKRALMTTASLFSTNP
ncbi:MAG: 3-ketoacyl-ACP reductase [Lutibacter sp.]|nr:MAG: 3-ketoacyl-ACP reductase [Lutibacter sp.]